MSHFFLKIMNELRSRNLLTTIWVSESLYIFLVAVLNWKPFIHFKTQIFIKKVLENHVGILNRCCKKKKLKKKCKPPVSLPRWSYDNSNSMLWTSDWWSSCIRFTLLLMHFRFWIRDWFLVEKSLTLMLYLLLLLLPFCCVSLVYMLEANHS